MKNTYALTAKINITTEFAATFDTDADFEDIALSISNLRNKAVDIRVSELGDSLSVEYVTFGAYGGRVVTKVENAAKFEAGINLLINDFLSK